MAHTVRRSLLLLALVLVGASCRVDVTVDVAMSADGSGIITVTAIADSDIVAKAPALAADLRFDDVKAAGWAVEGPQPTPEGGLQVVLTRPFATAAQATAILASLNGASGPLLGITLGRSRGDEATTFTLNGTLQVVGGLDAFSDPDLLAAVGATPYAAEITGANLLPADAVGITFTATMPGKISATTAETTSALSWVVPFDGVPVDVSTVSQQKDSKNRWASPVSKGALIALVAWAVFAVCFIGYVIVVRRRRAAIRSLR